MNCYPSMHISDCKKCKLGEREGVKVVHSILPESARVMIIGEAPGKQDNEEGIPFLGPAGSLFRQIMKEVGITEEQVAFTNIVACEPFSNKSPGKKEINTCFSFLEAEIKRTKPELIVPLGAVALKHLVPSASGINTMRGQWLNHPIYNCKIFPTIQPSYVLRFPMERSKLVKDMLEVSNFISGVTTQPEKKPTQYFVIKSINQLNWLVDILNKEILWACDTETTSLDPLTTEIFIISFSWKECTAALVDTRYFTDVEELKYVWSKLKEVLENNSKKIFQNGSFDVQCFMAYKSIYVNNYFADTMHSHYLLNENTNHGLEVLAWEYTDMGGYDIPLDQYRKINKIDSYKDIPMDIIHPYANADADVTLRTHLAMWPKIIQEGLEFEALNVMIPAQKILMYMEYKGVSIDVPYLDRITVKYAKKMEEQLEMVKKVPQVREFEREKISKAIDDLRQHWKASKTQSKKYPNFDDYLAFRQEKNADIVSFEFNINSPKQLTELLIDKMKLKVLKRTDKDNPSIDDEVLTEYAKSNKFCEALAGYRTTSHLKSTFLDGITNRLSPYNKIHTDYLVTSTVTGRPSSRNPNLNNIPRTSTASDIKDIFCCDRHQPIIEGSNEFDWLMEADLAQAEFRLWINYAKDEQALRDLNAGIDIHKLMASAAYHGVMLPKGNISYAQFKEIVYQVTKEERQNTKAVIFGLMYGRGVDSVAKQLGISKAQAQAIIDQFFNRYPQARLWIRITIAQAKRDGYITNLFGRKRRLVDILSNDPGRRAEAERQAINSPIQSGASDLVFLAAARIFKRFWGINPPMKTRAVLTVYDSLVFNIPDNELQKVVEIVDYEMKTHPFEGIIVPIASELKVGTHWGSLMEINPQNNWTTEYNTLCKFREETDKKFLIN